MYWSWYTLQLRKVFYKKVPKQKNMHVAQEPTHARTVSKWHSADMTEILSIGTLVG
jgi:hypothetical protein